MKNFIADLLLFVVLLALFVGFLFSIIMFLWGGLEMIILGSKGTYEKFGATPLLFFWGGFFFGLLCWLWYKFLRKNYRRPSHALERSNIFFKAYRCFFTPPKPNSSSRD